MPDTARPHTRGVTGVHGYRVASASRQPRTRTHPARSRRPKHKCTPSDVDARAQRKHAAADPGEFVSPCGPARQMVAVSCSGPGVLAEAGGS
eukprot:6350093-Prymnesium_polylepis.1